MVNDLSDLLLHGGKDFHLESFGERLAELICYEVCLQAHNVIPHKVTHAGSPLPVGDVDPQYVTSRVVVSLTRSIGLLEGLHARGL
eukprot:6469837-Amphidinium_carterae.3